MANLTTNYLGLNLKNPVIAGSSTLTFSIENIKTFSELNVGAIVLKSLFEEELASESNNFATDFHPESFDYNLSDVSILYGSKPYIDFVTKAKKVSNVPIIASVNCTGEKWWTDFAKSIEDAGADAVEINLCYMSFNPDDDPRKIEEKYFNTVDSIKSKIKIPLTVKIGHFFTNIPYMVKKLKNCGSDGVTLFNRYYRVGINLDKREYMPANVYSSPEEAYSVLRWVAVCSNLVDIDISASTGVHSPDIALQYIMAGAKTVQVVSKTYKNGIESIREIIDGINFYLDKNNIENVSDIYRKIKIDNEVKRLERLQYMKIANNKLF